MIIYPHVCPMSYGAGLLLQLLHMKVVHGLKGFVGGGNTGEELSVALVHHGVAVVGCGGLWCGCGGDGPA